jgi:ParB family chromosome partitioning protein
MKNDLAEQAIRNQWSVRELEDAVQRIENPEQPAVKKKKTLEKKDKYVLAAEEKLVEQLKTKVRIKAKKNTGTIEILYYSIEDLNRLLDLLGK